MRPQILVAEPSHYHDKRKSAVLRLFRYGDPQSVVNAKLVASAAMVGNRIADGIGHPVELPDGYKIVEVTDAMRAKLVERAPHLATRKLVLVDNFDWPITDGGDPEACAVFAIKIYEGWLSKLRDPGLEPKYPLAIDELESLVEAERHYRQHLLSSPA